MGTPRLLHVGIVPDGRSSWFSTINMRGGETHHRTPMLPQQQLDHRRMFLQHEV